MIYLGGVVLRRCGNIPPSAFFRMGCFTSRLIGLRLLVLSTT